jgi:hypothetical protein
MTFNSRGSFSLPQELFGSLVEDVEASDLPLGISPRCNDVFFLPGGIFTRPALKGLFASDGSGKIISVDDFRLASGEWQIITLDDQGKWKARDAITGSVTELLTVPGSCRQHYASYGDFLFAASSALGASPNPWATKQSGYHVPLYWNGKDVKRVTSDAPPPPSVAALNVAPVPVMVLSSTTTLSITGYYADGQEQYTETVYSDTDIGPTRTRTITYWTLITYQCSATVSSGLVGQTAVITGLTGSSYANRTGVITAVNGSTFSVAFYSGTYFSATGQSGAAAVGSATLYLTRTGNYVRAYVGSSLPANFKTGFWVSLTDSSGNVINSPSVTISSMSRDTKGIVTVTIASPWTNLIPGTVVYINPPTVNLAGVAGATNGSATVNFVSGSAFSQNFVGNVISLGGVDYVVGAQSGTTLTLTQPYQGTTANVSFSLTVTDFGAGSFQEVYEVKSPTQFTYQSLVTEPIASAAGGNCYIQWSPLGGFYGNAAQITSTGTDSTGAWIEWFQLGPDDQLLLSAAPNLTIIGQASPGTHQFVLFYENEDGAQTSPSTTVSAEASGNGNLFIFSNLPIGPPGTTKRIIAPTASGGDNFFYLAPATTAAQTGSGPSIITGTEIQDNTSVGATIDFSDAALLAAGATAIDVEGNDLFSQVRLDPCCGVYVYSGRLFWWGELNNRKNMQNLGFDAGYVAPAGTFEMLTGYPTATLGPGFTNFTSANVGATVIVGGVTYTIVSVGLGGLITLSGNWAGANGLFPFYMLSPAGAFPPYWDVSQGDKTGTLALDSVSGFSYVMPTGGNAEIRQGVYQDAYGGTILEPSTTYIVRILAGIAAYSGAGTLNVTLHSDTAGADSTASWNLSSLSADGWITGTITTPATMEADHVIRIYLAGSSAGGTVTIDELELLPETQPVLDQQIRASYALNPFGYDGNTGYIAPEGLRAPIAAMSQLRQNLYFLTELELRQTIDAQTEPSSWPIVIFDTECGCSSPWAIVASEDWILWGGRHGIRFFDGNPQTRKINQEMARTWESIRWDDPMAMWVGSDAVQRQTYIGIKLSSAIDVADRVLVLNYRLADSTYNVPDPIHISMYSGKMLATDLGRKWAPWYRSFPCGAPVTSNPYGLGVQKNFVFGGSLQQRLYTLDVLDYPPLNGNTTLSWNPVDDDWGGFASEYLSSFFFPREIESANPQIGSYRKLFAAMGYHAIGVGLLYVTPYLDSLNNPGVPLPVFVSVYPDRGYDLSLGLNVVCERMALGFSAPAGAAFGITHLNISGRVDNVFPMRGAL